MRTAKEWRREIGDQCGSRAGIYTDEEIAAIQDEAIAHGMTISAEIAGGETYADWPVRTVEEVSYDTACLDCKTAILTARDNKVWRKE